MAMLALLLERVDGCHGTWRLGPSGTSMADGGDLGEEHGQVSHGHSEGVLLCGGPCTGRRGSLEEGAITCIRGWYRGKGIKRL